MAADGRGDNVSELSYHYGPTATDPEPGKMWHYDCGGEVFFIDDGHVCLKCGEQDEDEEETSDG